MRDLARNSPLSDWKLFVRGLAAYYRGDQEETQANWNRLDPDRAPIRIARQLQNLRESRSGEKAGGPGLDKIESLVFGEPILHRIRDLNKLVVENRWADAFRRIVSLRLSLRAVDIRLDEKLTSGLLAPLLDHANTCDYTTAMGLLREFTRHAAPLAIDPAWNRFWALCWEEQSALEAIEYWRKYVIDLENGEVFSAENGLWHSRVWKHIGELYLQAIEDRSGEDDDYDDDFDDFDDEGDDAFVNNLDEEQLEQQARTCIERSLELAPRNRPTYDLLIDLCEMSNQPEQSEPMPGSASSRSFPKDVETLVSMAMELYERSESAAGCNSFRRLERRSRWTKIC